MHVIERFRVETHPGPYESWPSRSRLYCDGADTGTRVPGYTVVYQFQIGDEYLVVLDHDCPFEECFEVLLLDARFRIVSRASDPSRLFVIFAMAAGAIEFSSANLYMGHVVVGEREVRLLGMGGPPHLVVRVRERRSWWLGSRLDVRHEGGRPTSPR